MKSIYRISLRIGMTRMKALEKFHLLDEPLVCEYPFRSVAIRVHPWLNSGFLIHSLRFLRSFTANSTANSSSMQDRQVVRLADEFGVEIKEVVQPA